MPWRRPYYYRRRRHWYRPWRFRKTFRRRWRRRRPRWVRQRKRKTLNVRQYQPQCIRKCKIKGVLPLLYSTPERFIHNFESFELSTIPEKFPGGGGFSLKNITLNSLYIDHEYVRNIWTKSNTDLPLVRYLGCSLRFYKSEYVDYIVSYGNAVPMISNMDMYHSMHPAVHGMLKHKKIISSRKTNKNYKKPYTKIFVKPPAPLENKWFFQKDIYKLPLIQLRTSLTSLNHYYISERSPNSNITIHFLNANLFKNTAFKSAPTSGYYVQKHNEDPVYLYTMRTTDTTIIGKQAKDLIFLGNSTDNQPGEKIGTNNITQYTKPKWGNPFYKDYLQAKYTVFQSKTDVYTMVNRSENQIQASDGMTLVYLVDSIRYNPYKDFGKDNYIYFKSCVKNDEEDWSLPDNEELYSAHLPCWILTFGYFDFQKRLAKLKNLETEHVLALSCKYTSPTIRQTWPILSESFINGNSPYENRPNPQDFNRWYPCWQYQNEIANTIALSGPGTPKIPPQTSVECNLGFTFYFKWGGNPPPMSTIEDPSHQLNYPMPSNIYSSNSLQNPATNPSSILQSFDERRQTITEKAIQRIQKDYGLKTDFIADADRYLPAIQTTKETTSEEDSSEEEENTQTLLLKLHKQRLKQRNLKHRIAKHLKLLQELE
nr:MAG: ORF1 [TTV-like mini virus]